MSATVYDMRTGRRRSPPPNPQRDAELKHVRAMLKYLRMRIEIAQYQIENLERQELILQQQIESEWKESWG